MNVSRQVEATAAAFLELFAVDRRDDVRKAFVQVIEEHKTRNVGGVLALARLGALTRIASPLSSTDEKEFYRELELQLRTARDEAREYARAIIAGVPAKKQRPGRAN